MPKIPLFEGTGELTRQAPGARINPESQGVEGRMLQQAAEKVGEINQKFAKLDNARRYYEQSNALSKDLTELQTRAENDPNLYENRQDYLKEMQNLQQKHKGDFYDAETNLDFQSKAQLAFQNTQVSIDKTARKRLVDSAIGASVYNDEWLKNQYVKSGRDRQGMMERTAFKSTSMQETQRLLDLGAITPKEAADRNIKRDEEWGKDQVLFDIQSGRPLAEITQDLKSGEYGIKDPATILTLQRSAESMQKKIDVENKATVDRMQTQNMLSLMQKKANGTLTLQEANMVYQNDGTTPGITLADFKYLESDLVGAAPKQSEYDKGTAFRAATVEWVKMKEKGATEEEKNAYQKRLIGLKGRGFLDDGQFNKLINETSEVGPDNNVLGAGISILASWILPPGILTDAIRRFVDLAKEKKIGTDIEAVTKLANDILREEAIKKSGIDPGKEMPNAVISRNEPLQVIWDRKTSKLQVVDNARPSGSTGAGRGTKRAGATTQ